MPEKTRMGRPLKEPPAGTQVTLSLLVPAELKLKLQDKAVSSNRSLSQEAERRLQRSFSIKALQEDAIALAVEETSAQFSKQLTKELDERHTELEKFAAELQRQLDGQAHEHIAELRRRAADQALELEALQRRLQGSRTK